MPTIAGLNSPMPRVDAPTLQIFIEAFKSLSCIELHLGDFQLLTFKSNSSKIYPQLEQVLDDG